MSFSCISSKLFSVKLFVSDLIVSFNIRLCICLFCKLISGVFLREVFSPRGEVGLPVSEDHVVIP